MVKQNSAQLQNKIAILHKAIMNGDSSALGQAQALLRREPKNAMVAHLAAYACKQFGTPDKAEQYFLRSLALNPNQPEVHNNLANLYRDIKEWERATKHYEFALRLKSNFSEARRNFAITLSDQGNYEKALALLDEQLAQYPNDAIAVKVKADCLRITGDYQAATVTYTEAIELNKNFALAWHNRGLCRHLQGHTERALEDYLVAHQLQPEVVEISQSLGNTLHQLGRTNEGLAIFHQAITLEPLNAGLHERLNEILWEVDRKREFGLSFEKAIGANPLVLDLRLAYYNQLMRAKQLDRLQNQLPSALAHFSDYPEILALQAQVLTEQGDYESAHAAFDKALAADFSKDLAQQKIKLCMVSGDWDRAQILLDTLLENDRVCQLTWALQGTVWRALGDERYHWLNNYKKFVGIFTLPTPHGYDDLQHFLRELRTVLEMKHLTLNSPLNQTLVEGTQTAARLLYEQEPQIKALKRSIELVIAEYLRENLSVEAADKDHPLLSRKTESFEISGSWSVKLRANGFHVNHVHPEGWVSSSFYVDVPNFDEDSDQGSIKFGESPFALGDIDVPEKVVRPEAGMVVLFPSYMWHGTFAFDGDENTARLTAPFDVIPS